MNGKTDSEGGVYREALFYDKTDGCVTVCGLCPRRCRLGPGETGACLARRNEDGVLYSLNYGRISSIGLDPIEKKPLYRFHPGSMILSAGSFGCNFTCPFCQNYGISRNVPETRRVSPDDLVRKAAAARDFGNVGIAYTYNEPIVSYEFVKDVSVLARSHDLLNVLVTNGYIEPEPLKELLPYISAMNIDLKGDEVFYREMCGGGQKTVLRTIEASFAAGLHIEATTLLVSGRNDNIGAVTGVARAIAHISDDIPLHLTRFFPRYRMAGAAPTDAGFVYEAARVAKKYLRYVYTGNI